LRRADLRKLCRALRDLDVEYVLVGGMAVELAGYPTGTEDVDFAVTMREFERAMRKLNADPRFRNVESLGTIGGAGFFTGDRWIEIDFLNPTLFRGRKTGDDFMRYLRRYRSKETAFGPVARPEVTWYMRLVIPDWEIYVQKILRDARAGTPERTLEGALAIASVLGVDRVVAPRIRKTREFLEKATPAG
jgi:hypothetical protein